MDYLFFNAPLIPNPIRHSTDMTTDVFMRHKDERDTVHNIVSSLIDADISHKPLFHQNSNWCVVSWSTRTFGICVFLHPSPCIQPRSRADLSAGPT